MAAQALHVPATTAAGEKLSFEFLRYADQRSGTRYSHDSGCRNSDGAARTSSTWNSKTATHNNDDIRVRKDGFWCYCGPILTTNNPLPPSLDTWASATLSHNHNHNHNQNHQLSDSLWPFVEYANGVMQQFGLGHYWISVRATRSNAEFDMPRWHTDEMFFEPGIKRNRGDGSGERDGNDGEDRYSKGLWNILFPSSATSSAASRTDSQGAGSLSGKGRVRERDGDLITETDWKLCTTLLGPSTKFIPPQHQQRARELQRQAKRELAVDHSCVDIRCVGCAATAEAVRQRLAGDLEELGYVQAGTLGNGIAAEGKVEKNPDGLWCCFFRLGPETGAVHSEPPQGGGGEGLDRVFVNVVPGTEIELKGLMGKWGMEFPRDWSIVKEGGGWR